MNVVIMAGGGGTRLWPLSRKSSPKQFLRFGADNTTLLEQTYHRAATLGSSAKIYIATISEYADKIREILPQVPAENILLEPERRDTAPAFAAIAAHLADVGQGDEPTIFMWSDHIFTEQQHYLEDIRKIPALLQTQPDTIVIVGHVPLFPETGFGYIEAGEAVTGYQNAYHVKSFKEKPDRATAEGYVTAGNYFWNMGSISLTPNYVLRELRNSSPEWAQGMEQYQAALTTKDSSQIRQAYNALPKISIDYAVLEKAPRIIVVTGDYGWSDIGNWAAVQDIFGVSGDHMPAGHHVHVDSHDNYVYNTTDKVVSLVGLTNTIMVVTDDAILVTDKKLAHKVKDVVAALEAEGKSNVL